MAEAEAPQEPPGRLGWGDAESPQLLLNPVSPSDLQIVEALRSGRQGLGYAEDGLGLGQSAVPDLEAQLGINCGAEADRLGRRPYQDGSGMGGDLPPVGGKLDFGARPGIFSFRECLLGKGKVSLAALFSPAQEAFSWDLGARISAYRWL